MSERRVVIEHEDGMPQIIGLWADSSSIPAVLNVRDEQDRARIVRLRHVTDRSIHYVTEPLVDVSLPPTA